MSEVNVCMHADSTLESVDGGMKVTMMRHGNKVKHLGRPADQRKALIRTLVTQLIQHGAIRTTKVSDMSAYVETTRGMAISIRICLSVFVCSDL